MHNKQNVELIIKLKVNKKLLQAELVKKSEGLKDLSNIYTSSQKLNYGFKEIVQKLTTKYNCTVDFQTENTKFSAYSHMKKSFGLFPEMQFLDETSMSNLCYGSRKLSWNY
ncbi:hypothetical protein NQ314_015494 [Rhamnusium bicolor]|uniref:Uncharacterized protein n=1 Tax=Rhamnusium bicolor TaxID=1586634 RepID=A0AAV8WZ64_9CUCU|nr:hypothetical protein NQ314_015494 [Rhamnusium bicolor]